MDFLWNGLLSITWQQVVMYVVGLLLIYLAIEKNYEPALLLPMGFGAILVNLPASGVLNQFMEGAGETHGIIQCLSLNIIFWTISTLLSFHFGSTS